MTIIGNRLEPINKTYDINEGVQAKLKDPLFMLGTQWRVSEFQPSNGGYPVRLETKYRTHTLNELSLGSTSPENKIIQTKVPLEKHVEEEDNNQKSSAWSPTNLEYTFSISGGGVHISAHDYDGHRLDWYNFSVKDATFDDTAATIKAIRPSTIRYNGMPADRWYREEDGRVNLGDLKRPYLNILTMLLMEYSLIYSQDWFQIAIPHNVGDIRKMDYVRIVDSFGAVSEAQPITDVDPLQRGFEVFTLSAEENDGTTDASLFYFPNNLWHSLESTPLEEISFFIDEHANLYWGVEHKVTEAGELLVRDELHNQPGSITPSHVQSHYWDSETKQMIERPTEFPEGEPGNKIQGPLALYFESLLPPRNWVPYIKQLRNDKIVLRRGRTYVDDTTQFLGEIIKESHIIAEEEIPLHGIILTRIHQLARDCDGERIMWRSRKKRPGKFRNASNLAFDLLIEEGNTTLPLK